MTATGEKNNRPTHEEIDTTTHLAKWWQAAADRAVICQLCPHHCHIRPGQQGRCLARENRDGQLIAAAYGVVTSLALDPIEKKPLKWFFPGQTILSVGLFGCNFSCDFCQNWSIAQRAASGQPMTPQELAAESMRLTDAGNIGLAFTYNEPIINSEYILDCASLVQAQGQRCVLVTNGYIEDQPLRQLLPVIDAMNIDLKAFSDRFYRTICGGHLEPVKQTISTAAAACHVEVTTLLIPGLNDSEEEVDRLAAWLATINPDLPLHLTRYFPAYHRQSPGPISRERLLHLVTIAQRHLRRVVPGNLAE